MPKLETSQLLPLLERSRAICTWDLEATGLKGDYNSILCASVKPFGEKARTFSVDSPGKDKEVAKLVKAELEKHQAWIGYYSRGFDIKMLNTRLLFHGLEPVEPRIHLDMYYALKSKLLTARRSQGHLLNWLELSEQKMSLSAEEWNRILGNYSKHKKTMIARCESDVKGLEALYKRTRHLVKDIKA